MQIKTAEFFTTSVSLKTCPKDERWEVALAGRSNVGKSSLLNKLVNRKGLARTSNTPGRTQSINYFLINNEFFLVDLPGYGYAKVPAEIRAKWGPMMESYLSQRSRLKGVIQLVDIRHPPSALDLQLNEWLRYYRLPFAVVATKCDKLSNNQLVKQGKLIRNALGLELNQLSFFSSVTGQGRENLLGLVEQLLEQPPRIVRKKD